MTRRLTFAFPGRLDLNTGGYAYDRQVIAGLRRDGWTVDALPLGEGFPDPDPAILEAAGRELSRLTDNSLVLIDGLAFGCLDAWAAGEQKRLRIVALVHHPLALETGLDPDRQIKLRVSEYQALACARHVIVTSPMTAAELGRGYAVAKASLTVARPGVEAAAVATRRNGAPPQILSVGTLTRRKGHDILIAALDQIRDLPWSATVIGSRDLDTTTAANLDRQIGTLGLGDRITLAGECADTRPFYAAADIFALASRYEGYGMVFAEAMAAGLPIAACKAGAVPDVVPEDVGLLVRVDDVEAFAEALRLLLTDQGERRRRASASARAGRLLPTWQDTVQIIGTALEGID